MSDDTPLVLVVTMGTDYVAPARMPYELVRAGLRAAVLAPPDALAARTQHARVLAFPRRVTLFEWIALVDDACRTLQPALLLPGDDPTLRLLMGLVLDPPDGVAPALRERVERWLGPADRWLDAVDKTRLFERAMRAGLPVAPGGVATVEDDALGIAQRIGYPVIVRPAFGTAGAGVARCEDDAALRRAWQRASPSEGWIPAGAPRQLVQRWVDGEMFVRASLAWHGEEVAGATRTRIETHPAPFGPASVVAFVGDRAVRDASQVLARDLALHGYVGTQWIRDRDSGQTLLVEINRRMIPATHGARHAGIDLGAALAASLRGHRWNGPPDLPDGPGPRLALFPQEWYRDPSSRWLRTLPSDAPWHDPPLLAAMLRPA